MSKGKTKPTTKKQPETIRNTEKSIEKAEEKGMLDGKKPKEFRLFFIWRTLPAVFFGKSDKELKKLGIVDPIVVDLLKIRTQKEFAKQFKVREATLTEWKDKIKENGLEEDTFTFFKSLTKNVYAAFYNATIDNADAARVRLWLEEFANKKPEDQPPALPPMLGPQFTQVIINLREQYKGDLRSAYESIIRNKGEVPSAERVRADSSTGEEAGGEQDHRSGGDQGEDG